MVFVKCKEIQGKISNKTTKQIGKVYLYNNDDEILQDLMETNVRQRGA